MTTRSTSRCHPVPSASRANNHRPKSLVLHISLGKQDPPPGPIDHGAGAYRGLQAVSRTLEERGCKQRPGSECQQWYLAEWTLIVTNTSAKQVGVRQSLFLLRERWLIELLFKLWKSQGQIDVWRSPLPWHALCEVYAKLIAVMIQH